MNQPSSEKSRVSRRKFLKTTAGVTLFIGAAGILPQLVSCRNKEAIAALIKTQPLTAWVEMAPNGDIIIFNPAAEMGQGSMTSLPVIFAEEMDAVWEKVRVEFSPQESEIYGSNGWGPRGKIMLSAGSRITKGYYPIMRQAGAQVRYILMHSVSNHLDIPQEELSTIPGHVVHKNSNREWTFGEILSFLNMPEDLPEFEEGDLKDPKDYRLIGKIVERTDIPSKVNGSAQFAIDIQLPGMLFGVLERGRMHGAKPQLENKTDIEAMPGVVKVVELDHGIGIITDKIEQALGAKEALKINWIDAPTKGFNSEDAYEEYAKVASSSKKGNVIVDKGNSQNIARRISSKYTVDFKNDYVYHAQMEPLNAVVQIAEDGSQAEVWVGSQQGFDSKLGVPKTLGIDPDKVKVNLQYLGGGFGRRSMTDFVTECTLLAKEVKPSPVKLIWTREDDLTYGAYRPMSLQRLKAGTDRDGNLLSFSHYIIGDGNNLLASGARNEFYDIPHQHVELRII
ncbi:MAG: molybdopterin-dependent oxidoreductase, partial [Bacteroidia bacterium]|nr:molybdopterin-dependent oxidoreductase [Bacteroidia bacterium]